MVNPPRLWWGAILQGWLEQAIGGGFDSVGDGYWWGDIQAVLTVWLFIKVFALSFGVWGGMLELNSIPLV